MHHPRQRISVIALAIGIALPTLSLAQPLPDQPPPALPSPAQEPIEQRMLEMEARLRTLSDRVDMLERRAVTAKADTTTSATTSAGTSATAAGIIWTLDARVTDSPLRVTHKEFDRDRGRVDLLVQITAPLQDSEHWGEVGSEVPVTLKLRGVDGAEQVQAFTLARGKRIEPGAFVHLIADIDPARAATAGQFIIAPADK
jgi:hypothetical protein